MQRALAVRGQVRRMGREWGRQAGTVPAWPHNLSQGSGITLLGSLLTPLPVLQLPQVAAVFKQSEHVLPHERGAFSELNEAWDPICGRCYRPEPCSPQAYISKPQHTTCGCGREVRVRW